MNKKKTELLKKFGTLAAAAKHFNMARSTLDDKIRRGDPIEVVVAPRSLKQESAAASSKARSLADFRAAHDKDYIIPRKIKEALKQLGSGWEYEMQFCKMAGVSVSDLSNYRDMFADHVIVVTRAGKRAWAGTKSLADQMRSMVGGQHQ